MRVAVVVLVLAVAGLLVADLQPSAAPKPAAADPVRSLAQSVPEPETVEVAFLRNGWVTRVRREVPAGVEPELHALRELFRGPSRLERRRGIGTSLPRRARLKSLREEKNLWLASVSRVTFQSGSAETKQRRLWQVAATLAGLGEQRRAAIAVDGRLLTTVRLGVRPAAWSVELGEKGFAFDVRGLQLRLWALGYLARADVSGSLDYPTEQALLAFQGWEELVRTGSVTGGTQLALMRATRPEPTARRVGKRVEIYRDLGVLLLVEDGSVSRVVHVSTGAGGVTPVGSFSVYVKSLMSWSVPFKVWMPYASYFRGGIAMHQSPDVPSYPASHGCVRLPESEAQRVYAFADVGTPVVVR